MEHVNAPGNAIVTRLTFDNGWTASMRMDPRRPAFGVSCAAFHKDGRRTDIGPQEASDDEVAEWLAIVKNGFHA